MSGKKITPDVFYEQMNQICLDPDLDLEDIHFKMDQLMCSTLEFLGYEAGIDIFYRTPKWYS